MSALEERPSLAETLRTARGARGIAQLAALPRCTATAKSGEPCRSNSISGAGGQCYAHANPHGMALAAAAGRAAQKVPTITETLRARVEQRVDAVLDPVFAALEAERLVFPGGDGDAVSVADHGTRLRAVELVMDRLEGRPAQRTEHTGHGGGPVVLGLLTGDARNLI